MNIIEQIKQLVLIYSKQKKQIKDQTNLRTDLGIDSLSLFELFVEIQQEFEISICSEELLQIQTFNDLKKIIERKIKK